MYSIDEMVEICVKGDVVKPGNAEYLRRNLEEFMSYDMPAIVKKVQELQYDLSEALTVLQTTLTLNPNAINDINKKVLEKHKRFDVFTEAGF